jgi:hypothetical protein
MYDDEFYHEPSEFDQQVDEFKKSILIAVKEEFKAEMDSLRKENQELQKVKENFKSIQQDFKNKHRQLENERNELERKIRREKLSELLKDHEVIMYRTSVKYEKLPKCNKCDERRRVNYTTPLGKEAYEDCTCSFSKQKYVIEERIRTEFKLNSHNHSMTVWYEKYEGGDGYSYSEVPDVIYQEGMKYEDIEKSHRVYFSSKEECQKYCDWLNDKKGSEA